MGPARLGLALLLLASCSEGRPEPTGFGDIAWGTPHDTVEVQLFKAHHCRWDWSGASYVRVTCLMPGFAGLPGEPVVIFAFAPDKTFGEYCVVTDGARGIDALRALTDEKFGRGRSWVWRGATADYEANSRGAMLCARSRAFVAAVEAKGAEQAKAGSKKF